MKKSPKLGFSLIELSVVILVIGLLVLGITKGSRIIRESKLKSAQSLTYSSAVNSIPNLAFWVEATSQKSFNEAEKIDTAIGATGTISTWYDINSQSPIQNNATQTTSNLKPRYIANAINGLPAINFDGSDDFLTFNTPFDLSKDSWEIYVVVQPRNGVSNSFFIGSNSNTAIGYHNTSMNFCGTGSCLGYGSISAYSTPKPIVVSFSYKSWDANYYSIYYFGRRTTEYTNSINTLSRPTNSAQMYLGKSSGFSLISGEIAEVIIFSRALTNSEKVSVREYLKTKWKIIN